MHRNGQIGAFASYFHQDFGDTPGDILESNITSFFASVDYVNGQEMIEQINAFEKKILAPSGRGSSWLDIGGYMWSRELENPKTWEVLKELAKDYPDGNHVRSNRDEFDSRVHRLLSAI
jgi:hypothetical protein